MALRTSAACGRRPTASNWRAFAIAALSLATFATAPELACAASDDDGGPAAVGESVNHAVWLRLHVDPKGEGRLDNGPLSIPDPLFQRLNRFVGSLQFEPARRSGKPVSGTIGLMFDLELQDQGGERLVVWIDQVLVAPLPTKIYTPSFPLDAIRKKRSGRVEGTFVVKANGRPGRLRASSTPAAAAVFRFATADALLNAQFEAPTVDGERVEIEVSFCHVYHWDPSTAYDGPPCARDSHAPSDDRLALTRLPVEIQRQEVP